VISRGLGLHFEVLTGCHIQQIPYVLLLLYRNRYWNQSMFKFETSSLIIRRRQFERSELDCPLYIGLYLLLDALELSIQPYRYVPLIDYNPGAPLSSSNLVALYSASIIDDHISIEIHKQNTKAKVTLSLHPGVVFQ
jgi:hypothetical protein